MNLPNQSTNRIDLWIQILNQVTPKTVAEIGVAKGVFAAEILNGCPSIERYIMVDPWAQLPDWNKPLNVSNNKFEEIYDEAIQKTEFAAEKRHILRGRTKDVIEEICNDSLDFVYIDGDHTLRGITIDLIKIIPKVKPGGLVGGDDFTYSPWQHSLDYEPTLVCPFAVYYAEAADLPIKALPHGQFLIEKSTEGFHFDDTTGTYSDLSLNGIGTKRIDFFQKVKKKLKRLIK